MSQNTAAGSTSSITNEAIVAEGVLLEKKAAEPDTECTAVAPSGETADVVDVSQTGSHEEEEHRCDDTSSFVTVPEAIEAVADADRAPNDTPIAVDEVTHVMPSETPVLTAEATEDAKPVQEAAIFIAEPPQPDENESDGDRKRQREADADNAAAHADPQAPQSVEPVSSEHVAVSQPKIARTESQQETSEAPVTEALETAACPTEAVDAEGSAAPTGRHSSSSASEAGTPTPPVDEKHTALVKSTEPSRQIESTAVSHA